MAKSTAAPTNYLDSDPTIIENNLKFVKNEMETVLDEMLDTRPNLLDTTTQRNDFKVVTPSPGLCIKCYKVGTDEKFFINLCQTDAIPMPEDITEENLTQILQSDAPSSYRIPMSISQPRLTKDRSNHPVDVCDIAINSIFLHKCETQLYFRDFLIAVMLEALDKKYNVQINANNWLILKNRKLMGTLIQHRVQNRDVKHVYESYQNPQATDLKLIQEMEKNDEQQTSQKKKILIQEIDEKDINQYKDYNNVSNISKSLLSSKNSENSLKIHESSMKTTTNNCIIPEHKIFSIKKGGEKVEEILAEFFLPECLGANDIKVEIGEDRIFVESRKQCYLFDRFLDYTVDQEKTVAKFDLTNKMLAIKMVTVDPT